MTRAIKRYMAWMLAFALVMSGATWSQCTAAHLASSGLAVASTSVASTSVAAQAVTGEHAHHHHTAVQAENAQAASAGLDSGASVSGDHACQKCCGMCGITTVLGDYPTLKIALVEHSVTFEVRRDHAAGRTLWLDPEIPKHLS